MPTVMVVEDEALILANVSQILQMAGLAVIEAENGEIAWQLLLQQQDLPKLVLTDLSMPVLDGLGLVQRIKSHTTFASIPCVILSARSDPAEIDHAFSLGVSEYLVKPFEIDRLLATLVPFIEDADSQLLSLSAAFRSA